MNIEIIFIKYNYRLAMYVNVFKTRYPPVFNIVRHDMTMYPVAYVPVASFRKPENISYLRLYSTFQIAFILIS